MAKADVLRRVRQNLRSARPAEHSYTQEISAIADGSTTTITVNDGTIWEAGDILEVEETGELCYVRSVATNDLTVIRGYLGTTAAATTDTVPLARKNPRFTEQDLLDQYDRVLASLWSHGVFQWATQAIVSDQTKNPQLVTVLDATVRDIIAVEIDSTNDEGEAIHVPFRARQNGENVELLLVWPPDTDFTASAVLTYASPITNIDTETIHPEVEQVLEDGITYRLLASTTAPRTFDPGQLTDRSVQPGQGARDARFYQGEFILGVRRISQDQKVQRGDRRVGQDYRTSRARRWRV